VPTIDTSWPWLLYYWPGDKKKNGKRAYGFSSADKRNQTHTWTHSCDWTKCIKKTTPKEIRSHGVSTKPHTWTPSDWGTAQEQRGLVYGQEIISRSNYFQRSVLLRQPLCTHFSVLSTSSIVKPAMYKRKNKSDMFKMCSQVVGRLD
jgi:hypothetical protein